MNPKAFNKPRINSIDVLRGFALVGILLLHCLEHFESYHTPKLESPFWQWIDTAIHDTLLTIFYGFGFGLANQTYLVCFLIGLLLCSLQIWYSNQHFKRYYYGPMEWLWRTLTWFKRIPMKRR